MRDPLFLRSPLCLEDGITITQCDPGFEVTEELIVEFFPSYRKELLADAQQAQGRGEKYVYFPRTDVRGGKCCSIPFAECLDFTQE